MNAITKRPRVFVNWPDGSCTPGFLEYTTIDGEHIMAPDLAPASLVQVPAEMVEYVDDLHLEFSTQQKAA